MEDVRSVSGYVGLQNLGATCYMATCMQHLYMIPAAREAVLQVEVRALFITLNTLYMMHITLNGEACWVK